jgi:hypothetical protein
MHPVRGHHAFTGMQMETEEVNSYLLGISSLKFSSDLCILLVAGLSSTQSSHIYNSRTDGTDRQVILSECSSPAYFRHLQNYIWRVFVVFSPVKNFFTGGQGGKEISV